MGVREQQEPGLKETQRSSTQPVRAMCDALALKEMSISGTHVPQVPRILSTPSRQRRRGICPSRRASTPANHQYDRQGTRACETEGIWSVRAWLAATHTDGSVRKNSQPRLPPRRAHARPCTSRQLDRRWIRSAMKKSRDQLLFLIPDIINDYRVEAIGEKLTQRG